MAASLKVHATYFTERLINDALVVNWEEDLGVSLWRMDYMVTDC